MTVARHRHNAHAGHESPPGARRRAIYYPESDGKPMAETPAHRDALIDGVLVLKDRFAGDPNVYVSGNMMMYDEEGNPRRSISPDVFVTLGVPKLPERETYRVWEEGAPPTFVVEITSRSTRTEDRVRKRDRYARMGVQEYFLFDPGSRYDPPTWRELRGLPPPRRPRPQRPPSLEGYRLAGGVYEPLTPDAEGRLLSEALGLHLRLVEGWLRFFDPATGAMLLTPSERATAEAARATAEAARAAAEAARATAEAARATAEAARADAAEARIAELLALLARRGPDAP